MALFSCLNVSHSGSDGMKLSTFTQVLDLSTCLNLSVYFYFLVFFATLHFHYILGSKYFTFYSSYSFDNLQYRRIGHLSNSCSKQVGGSISPLTAAYCSF